MKACKTFLFLFLVLCFAIFVACTTDAPSEPVDLSTQASADTTTESIDLSTQPPADTPTEPVSEALASPIETQAATETDTATETASASLLLPSDFTTELYSVTKIDGACYLNFNDGNTFTPTGDESLDYVFAGVYYDSYEELRDAFLNGTLSTGTINTIKQQFEQTDQGIHVLDVVNMGKPMLPSNCNIQDKICWTGKELVYNVDSSQYGSWGFLTLTTDDLYEEYHSQYYSNVLENFTITSETDSTLDGTPCKIYEIENSSGIYRDIKMEVTRENQTFYIHMRYVIDHYDDMLPESDTLPFSVYIFSESNNQGYMVQQFNFEETPTPDWMTSFVLAPVSDIPQSAS